MDPVRAYYLPTDSTSAIDASGPPVSVEQLDALGWKISNVGDSPDEVEQAGRKLAQELGFPVTQKGCSLPFSFNPEQNAAMMDPEMVALLMKAVKVNNGDMGFANEFVIAITNGAKPYFDVEDVATAGWIRVHFAVGRFVISAPTGAKFRLPFDEHNRESVGTVFFKETLSNHGLLVKEEIDNHPARKAYVNAHT
ncbi:hypothetical protein BDP27DRAFT_1435525 [Rhodocollybia butyracea]|uniref:Uncharacterized protein n=1 Tax=Rhodocollybia butyracea TaxID=206335 RepID=A0A9P5P4Z2_9AGAR|nr:hypothetical protein BDP27DRAFT_1435525 [Rhodocollybia butyracea]